MHGRDGYCPSLSWLSTAHVFSCCLQTVDGTTGMIIPLRASLSLKTPSTGYPDSWLVLNLNSIDHDWKYGCRSSNKFFFSSDHGERDGEEKGSGKGQNSFKFRVDRVQILTERRGWKVWRSLLALPHPAPKDMQLLDYIALGHWINMSILKDWGMQDFVHVWRDVRDAQKCLC